MRSVFSDEQRLRYESKLQRCSSCDRVSAHLVILTHTKLSTMAQMYKKSLLIGEYIVFKHMKPQLLKCEQNCS